MTRRAKNVRQSEALERLREQVNAASRGVQSSPIWGMELPELRERAEAHKIGTCLFPWSNPYPKTDPRSLLLPYQFERFHDTSRFILDVQARQTGKDFTGEGEIVTDCRANAQARWTVAAPSERQSLESLDLAKTWSEAYDLGIKSITEERVGTTSETLLKSAEITFANGSRIRAVPGKPDTVRGPSSSVFLTEFDFFEYPDLTWRAILPLITNPLRGGVKKMRIASTANGKGGALHNLMTKRNTAKMRWSKRLVTIYHAVLMGLPIDIAELREAMDDAEGFAQEFECKFLDASNVLLPYDVLALAESIDATQTWTPPDSKSARNQIYVGIDFGRTQDSTVCWTLQRVGDVLWTREVLVLKGTPTNEQQELLRSRIRCANRVSFDYTGPGIGLGDYLVEEHKEYKPSAHKFGKVELCTFTAPFKRELFPKLRREFEAPVHLRIPISVAIREDLHQMQQTVSNGAFSYWSPRTRDGHSDRCTALALAVRAAGKASAPFAYESANPERNSHRTGITAGARRRINRSSRSPVV